MITFKSQEATYLTHIRFVYMLIVLVLNNALPTRYDSRGSIVPCLYF